MAGNAHPPLAPVPLSERDDIDLYCLTCGYNLRGLTGDPRRCPECGNLNPIGDVEIPASAIKTQLMKMESAPAYCVAAVLVVLASLAGLVAARAKLRPSALQDVIWVFVVAVGAASVIWLVGVHRFRKSCLDKPGWERALWRYHVHGVFLSLLVAMIAPSLMVIETLEGTEGGWVQFLGAFVAALVGLVFCIRWSYRRAKENMEPLQRDVAVTMARHALRRQLQKRRHGFSR